MAFSPFPIMVANGIYILAMLWEEKEANESIVTKSSDKTIHTIHFIKEWMES